MALPLHLRHGFLIDDPSPPHVGHGLSIEKNPCVELTFPLPLHAEQILGPALSALPVAPHKSPIVTVFLSGIFFTTKSFVQTYSHIIS